MTVVHANDTSAGFVRLPDLNSKHGSSGHTKETKTTTHVAQKSLPSVTTPAQNLRGVPVPPPGSKPHRQRPKKQWSGMFPTMEKAPACNELSDLIFNALDVNGDGVIANSEWTKFFEVVNQQSDTSWAAMNSRAQKQKSSPASMDAAFSAADLDGSSTIDKEEWTAYIKAFMDLVGEREWKKTAKLILDALERKNVEESRKPSNQALKGPTAEEALAWLEVDNGDWLKPNADSAVTFSPIERKMLKKYFKMRDADHSESLSLPELEHVIQDIGRTPPSGTEEERIYKELVQSADRTKDGSLNFDEFMSFMAAYCHGLYERVFRAFDEDGSHTISKDELGNALKLLGKAGFEVSWDQVEKDVLQVDKDGNGTLDFDEFCHLMQAYRKIELEQLKSCSGFPRRKIDGLKDLFDSADVDLSGSLSAREIATLFDKTHLGRSLDTREDLYNFSCLFKRMDRDHSCTLDFEEFLRLLRVWSNGGLVKEEKVQSSSTAQNVRYEKFGDAKEAILDGWAEEFEHDLEDTNLSKTWGFPENEVRIMRDCFEFTDVNGSGKIQHSELIPFMQSVGHHLDSGNQKQKEALATTVNGRNTKDGLKFSEAVELVFAYEKELSISALGGQEDKIVKRDQLLTILYRIGIYITPKSAEQLCQQANISTTEAAEEMISCQDLRRVLEALRSQHMTSWLQTCGFKDSDVENFGSAFTELLVESGNAECELPLEKVRQLLEKLDVVNPSKSGQGKGERMKMFRAITRVDRDNSGSMSFQEFLLLVRYFKNIEMYRYVQENEQAIRKFRLDGEPGEQLLRLFNDRDKDDDFRISQEDLVGILRDLGLAKTAPQRAQVRRYMSVWSNSDPNLLITFPNFLEIIQEIEKKGDLG